MALAAPLGPITSIRRPPLAAHLTLVFSIFRFFKKMASRALFKASAYEKFSELPVIIIAAVLGDLQMAWNQPDGWSSTYQILYFASLPDEG